MVNNIVIDINKLSFEYGLPAESGSLQILQDVSFTIKNREFVCILGPSGCGKTTLLQILAGFFNPKSGTISVEAHHSPSENHVDRTIVFQDLGLFYWLTAATNVSLAVRARGVPKNKALIVSGSYLERLGLGAYGNYYPHELSGGMRQRLAIARALATEAPILLLDEPFSSLDAQLQRTVEQDLLRIWDTESLTVCAVTHDVRQAIRLADRVIVFSHRPGTVRATINIDLPRPRLAEHEYSSEFRHMEEELWHLLS